jgi:hypothetical protein
MLALKYLLMILGVALFGSAAGLVGYDIFLAMQVRRLLRRKTARGRWNLRRLKSGRTQACATGIR